MSSEDQFDDLAGAVLDGAAVDWAAAESGADADGRPIVRHFRLIATVAEAHRHVWGADDPGPEVPSGPKVPLDRWGHLHIHERIGRGSFGDVFRAWDPRLDREVALKLLPADASRSADAESPIIREGRLLARVRHPNVVTIYGAEQIADRIGLWMELVRGQTLEQELKTRGPFPAADVVALGVEIARAVSAVHAAGLLHRDIKAQNVTRADDGRVVLMDFGAGSELHASPDADLAGTPLYAAPEVLAGRPATVRSDVYSLGVLLYHLATGSYPVRGRTVRDVRDAHGRGERTAIRRVRPDLRPGLARAIERACDPRPEGRYDSADALIRDLQPLQRSPTRIVLRYGLAAAVTAMAAVAAVVVVSEVRARISGEGQGLGSRIVASIRGEPRPLDHPIIAVLPFRNVSGDPGADLVVDDVTVGLIRELAVIEGLQVKSATSSFMLRGRPRDLSDVASRLGVNMVVEGDAQVAAGRLVIRAALVPVADGGNPLWSDTLSRELRSEADLVAVVEDLTRTIVNRLRLKLGRTQRRYDTTNIATFQTYLQARAMRDARGPGARASVRLFEEVIRADPAYAPAKAALAATYGFMSVDYPAAEGYTIPPKDAAGLMAPLTASALEIDPGLAEAHASMGFLHAMALRWSDAEASFRRAIANDPSLTTLQGDFVLSTLVPWGRLDDALTVMEAAVAADPLSLDRRRVLGFVQLQAGQFVAARDSFQRVLDMDPAFPFAENLLRWALLFSGQPGDKEKAIERFEKFSVGRPGVLGYLHAIAGRRAEAEAIAAQFAHLPQRQAEIYGLLGDSDRALEALERLAALNPIRAARHLSSPELHFLRGDPRVDAFRQKLGFPRQGVMNR